MAHKKKWMSLKDMDPVKKIILKNIRMPGLFKLISDFRAVYNKCKGNVDDHVRYSADPILEILYPFYEQLSSMFYEKHVRQAMEDGGVFLLWLSSGDSAYRPARNLLLDWLTQPEIVKKIRAALEKEQQTEDYTNADNWFDNMKVLAVRKTEKMRTEGVLPEGVISSTEAVFIDEKNFDEFKQKLINKEV